MKRECEMCTVMFDGFHATGKLDMVPAVERVVALHEQGIQPPLCPQHRDALRQIVNAKRVERDREREQKDKRPL